MLAQAAAKDPSKRFANLLGVRSRLYAAGVQFGQGRQRRGATPSTKEGGKTLAGAMEDISLEQEVDQVFALKRGRPPSAGGSLSAGITMAGQRIWGSVRRYSSDSRLRALNS